MQLKQQSTKWRAELSYTALVANVVLSLQEPPQKTSGSEKALRESKMMNETAVQDTVLFFDQHQGVYSLYEHFQEKLLARFPESRIKVQKS